MIKRIITAVMVTVALFSTSTIAWAAEYWVHPDGNDVPGGGDPNHPFKTIQYAIDQCTSDNNDIINVQDDPCEPNDYVTPPIYVNYDKVKLIFEQGLVVEAEPNAFPNYDDCLFEAVSKNNITFTGCGTGATLQMRRSEYPPEHQHRHVISLKSCSDVNIMGLTLKDSGGDGIYIGRDLEGQKEYCENILINDVTCDNNYRNAISVISANDVTIENCVLKNTNGTPPQAGIDFEPNNSDERLTNIVMRNCIFENNYEQGICVSPHALAGSSEPISMLFEDCYVTGGWSGLRVSYVHGPSGSIEFKNITVEDVDAHGARIFDKSSDSAYVRFTNCLWQNITGPHAPVYIFVQNEFVEVPEPGGIDFIDCQVYDDIDRPAIECSNNIDDLYEIDGDLYVINPNRTDPLYDWHGATLHDCHIEVHRGVADFFKAFNVKNSSGDTVALFDIVGNLVLTGTLDANTTPTADPNDEFRFQDANGVDLMIIDANSGNMYIAGGLYEDQTALVPEGYHNFIIKDWDDDVVAYVYDPNGDVYLKGWLYENAEP